MPTLAEIIQAQAQAQRQVEQARARPSSAQELRSQQQVIEDNLRARARDMSAEWLRQQMAGAAPQGPINQAAVQQGGQASNSIGHQGIDPEEFMNRQQDPEVNRIAEKFYVALMSRIRFEFGFTNPSWEELGAREKKLWLEAAEILIRELQGTPIATVAVENRRIIA